MVRCFCLICPFRSSVATNFKLQCKWEIDLFFYHKLIWFGIFLYLFSCSPDSQQQIYLWNFQFNSSNSLQIYWSHICRVHCASCNCTPDCKIWRFCFEYVVGTHKRKLYSASCFHCCFNWSHNQWRVIFVRLAAGNRNVILPACASAAVKVYG